MIGQLTATEVDTLVEVATASIRHAVLDHVAWRPVPGDFPPVLREPAAAFVTLHRDGRLKGCVGTLSAVDPLVVTVADRARAAALDDPRFRPVEPDDVAHLEVEVSVLTGSTPVEVSGYDDLVRTVRPGVDGVTVEAGPHRATLLPAVWDDVPTAAAFLGALWRKAGLEPGEWPRTVRVSRYSDAARALPR